MSHCHKMSNYVKPISHTRLEQVTWNSRSKGRDKSVCVYVCVVVCVLWSSGWTSQCWHKKQSHTAACSSVYSTTIHPNHCHVGFFLCVQFFFKLHDRAVLFNVECKHTDVPMKAPCQACFSVGVSCLSSYFSKAHSSVSCSLIYQIYRQCFPEDL